MYEMMVRGIGVMRRRSDSWLNATQILKVAGIEKGRRTKILEKDIAQSEGGKIPYEKIQGGYGRYQGTWIPFHCAQELAEQYGVLQLIQPLLDYKPAPSAAPLSGLGTAGSPPSGPGNNNGNINKADPNVSLSSSANSNANTNSGSATANKNNSRNSPAKQTVSRNTSQAAFANPQAQKAAQQASLSQAQKQVPLPTTRVNGNLALDASVSQTPRTAASKKRDAAKPAAASTSADVQVSATGRKRPRVAAAQAQARAAAAAAAEEASTAAKTETDGADPVGEEDEEMSVAEDEHGSDGDLDLDLGEGTSSAAGAPGDATLRAPEGDARGKAAAVRRSSAIGASGKAPQNVTSQTQPLVIRRASRFPEDVEVNFDHRNLLMSLFISEAQASTSASGPPGVETEPDPLATIASFPPDLDPDTPIDDQQHTALHWASALARMSTVKALLQMGADPNRGNATGETPLMRAVLVTNNFDTETFASPYLLQALSPSIKTLDDARRSVLHHIALVAGIKGRSASARHYLETILHYLIQTGSPSGLRDFVNVRDENGDTALNIAARVGSRPVVRMLLDSGADPQIPNKLYLFPGDFGSLEEGLVPPTEAERATAHLAEYPDPLSSSSASQLHASSSGQQQPHQRTHQFSEQSYLENAQRLSKMFDDVLKTLATDFGKELQARSESLERTQSQLLLAAKELADQRSTNAELRETVKQVELTKWRIRNLEKALEDEDRFDWTGRSTAGGRPAFPTNPSADDDTGPSADPIKRAAFEYRGVNSTLGTLQAVNMPSSIAADPRDPADVAASNNQQQSTAADDSSSQNGGGSKRSTPSSTNLSASNSNSGSPSLLTLAQIRRMVIWYERVLDVLRERIDIIKSSNGDMELDARRVVKLCTGLESDEDVEELLPSLIVALESDGGEGAIFDLQR